MSSTDISGTNKRQVFSESEKMCLQELIIKYKLNTAETTTAGNPATKKMAWGRLLQEYNSIGTNTKRTEVQLKKCWDNLKTRKKSSLRAEKRERMKTGGGPYIPQPGTSTDPTLLDDALLEQTDVELQYVIDSDNLPAETSQGTDETMEVLDALPAQPTPLEHGPPQPEMQPDTERVQQRSGSQHTDYGGSSHQTSGVKNARAKAIDEEVLLRQQMYDRQQKQEEELHKLRLEEQKFKNMIAENLHKKSILEIEIAQQILLYHKAKVAAAELELNKLK